MSCRLQSKLDFSGQIDTGYEMIAIRVIQNEIFVVECICRIITLGRVEKRKAF